jgi:hypothetical protein
MSKDEPKAADELRPEYERSDFSTLVRGKYADPGGGSSPLGGGGLDQGGGKEGGGSLEGNGRPSS